MKVQILLLSFLFTTTSRAQDTTHKVSFKIGAEFWGTYVSYPLNPGIHYSKYLQERLPNSFDSYDTLKDAPILHGAYYTAIKTTTSFTPGIKLQADLYAEHRGISYGIFNSKNTVVYPVMCLRVKDSLTFLNRKFIIEGSVGDFLNKRLNEGLFLYNIDLQGGEGSISSGKWKLGATWYGDFSNGIGLNIDDAYGLSLQRSFGKTDSTIAGLAINSLNAPGESRLDFLHYSAFFKHSFKNAHIYAQAGFQNANNMANFFAKNTKSLSAFVIGADMRYRQSKFSGKNMLEARYYGSTLNFFHNDHKVRYRDVNGDLYANTVGDYLYPLRRYDNPFSQWAIFTDYFTCDVFGVTLQGNINYAVSKKTEANIEYDFNYIAASENTAYNSSGIKSEILYTFFTAGYYYSPLPNCKAGIIITNRGMNLNYSYPTLFQFTKPYFGFQIRCSL